MKKILCLLLTLACILGMFSAAAENSFTLRNGLHFGDSEKTVDQNETWEEITGIHVFDYRGKLMGLPAMVKYIVGTEDESKNIYPTLFEDQKGLKCVTYCINTVYDENGKTVYSPVSCFNTVCSALRIKYGEALPASEMRDQGRKDPFLLLYIHWLASVAMSRSDFESISVDPQRTMWVIPGDKADVVIEVHEYKMVQNGKPCFFTLLNYSAYTDRELRDWQQSIEQEYGF